MVLEVANAMSPRRVLSWQIFVSDGGEQLIAGWKGNSLIGEKI